MALQYPHQCLNLWLQNLYCASVDTVVRCRSTVGGICNSRRIKDISHSKKYIVNERFSQFLALNRISIA